MPNQLDQLKAMTTVVADTGDIQAIENFKPADATTNPSLLFKAAQLDQYQELITEAVTHAQKKAAGTDAQIKLAADQFGAIIGREISKIIPGYISTEVDARLSFNTAKTIEEARRIVQRYRDINVEPERILVKIAATWEGIQAAQVLQQEGIRCNMTLLFSLIQAIACANAGAFLISPFVGRILDWHLAETGQTSIPVEEDPGVASVTAIYNYYKQHDIPTVIMGASFRNVDQIQHLAGCDRLTVSPALMQVLTELDTQLDRHLSPETAASQMPLNQPDEPTFRWELNEDAMASTKLAEGIRLFARDQERLESKIRSLIE